MTAMTHHEPTSQVERAAVIARLSHLMTFAADMNNTEDLVERTLGITDENERSSVVARIAALEARLRAEGQGR